MAINHTTEGGHLVGAPSVNVADSPDERLYRARVAGDLHDRLVLTAGGVLAGDGSAEPTAVGGGGGAMQVVTVTAQYVSTSMEVVSFSASDSFILTALGSNVTVVGGLVTAAATNDLQAGLPSIYSNAPFSVVSYVWRFHQVAGADGVLAAGPIVDLIPTESFPVAATLLLPGIYGITLTLENADETDYSVTGGIVTLKAAGTWAAKVQVSTSL